MADLMQHAKEKKDADSVPDRADITQESLKSRMSSLRKNTSRVFSRLPLNSSEKPLNGVQPALFVCGSVPDADADVSPTAVLANGPSLHVPSDELCLSNNGSSSLSKTATEKSGKISQPLSESKTDFVKNVPGILPKGSEFCAKVVGSKGGASKSRLLDEYSADSDDDIPVSQMWVPKGIDARRIWDFDTESSESSSDDYESTSDLNWDPQKEFMQFLWNDHDDPDLGKKLETVPPASGGRRRKRKMDMVVMVDPSEEIFDEKLLADDNSDFEGGVPNAISSSNVHSRRKRPKLQSSLDSCETYPSDTVEAIKQLMLSAPTKKNKDGGRRKVDADMGSEEEPSFFPCTKCNVNFKEKKHLHRHMMHHLDGNSQFRLMNVPRPFICRECGRSFRDRNSLLKHMTIHQERRERLMEEIKGLNKLKDEGRTARLQCPQCVFGTNCPNTFVQHAKTHEKDKRYYCCEECDFMAVTERELESHQCSAHGFAYKPQYITMKKNDLENRTLVTKKNNAVDSSSLLCKICPYRTQSKNALKKHVELIHQQPYVDSDSPPHDSTNNYATPVREPHKFAGKSQKTDLVEAKPKLSIEKQPLRKKTGLPLRSDDIADLIRKKKTSQKARKGVSSSLAKWGFGNSPKKQMPALEGSDKESKPSLQQAEKIDITTGLPYVEDGYTDSDQVYGGTFSSNAKKPNSSPSCYNQPTPKTEKPNDIYYPGCNSDKGKGAVVERDGKTLTLEPTIKGKTPSKRKMSTPFHNTMDKAPQLLLPNQEQTPKRHEMPVDMGDAVCEGAYDFDDYSSESTSNFLDSSENKQNPYVRSYFIRQQRFSTKEEGSPNNLSEKDCDGENSREPIQKLVVKEECIETELCQEAPDATMGPHSDPLQDFEMSPFGTDRKSCPYCPAQFESGVGLSNHVRGHLHRVGLSYNARHVVSPEQVASQDRRPRIRRKITSIRRIKKVHKAESPTEHTCPLCGGWFDTKTGLSNHVRGHLKRIGKTITSTSKSPLCILNEMMQDEEEYRNILQVLNKKQFLSRPFVSQKFASSDGLFLSPAGVPVKVRHIGQDGKLWEPVMSNQEEQSVEKEPAGTKHGVKGPHSSTLIELLKKKKLEEEMEKNHSQTARKCVSVSPSKDRTIATQPVKTESCWLPEKNELNKKVCIHCNTTFPSAVSLSNHLRAYARRKRVALLEGTTYDCKQKKPRSRPGSKKKMFSMPNAADEIYRLTCRFCDLVFQGPLSVQEDWIKHLQRHIMNTSVPHTGAGMVEVTSLPKDPSSPQRQTSLPPATQAAS